jgi:hypothetical protein
MAGRSSLAALVVLLWSNFAYPAEITELPGEHPRIIAITGELQLGDNQKFVQVVLPVDRAIILFNSGASINVHEAPKQTRAALAALRQRLMLRRKVREALIRHQE